LFFFFLKENFDFSELWDEMDENILAVALRYEQPKIVGFALKKGLYPTIAARNKQGDTPITMLRRMHLYHPCKLMCIAWAQKYLDEIARSSFYNMAQVNQIKEGESVE